MRELFVLDTNHVSDFITGRSPALEQRMLRELGGGNEVAISALTHAEVLFGFAKNPAMVHARVAYGKFLPETSIIPWTAESGSSYSQLRMYLKSKRLVVDTMDLLMASQAHALGATLVTRDKDFRHVSELVKIVNWATD